MRISRFIAVNNYRLHESLSDRAYRSIWFPLPAENPFPGRLRARYRIVSGPRARRIRTTIGRHVQNRTRNDNILLLLVREYSINLESSASTYIFGFLVEHWRGRENK